MVTPRAKHGNFVSLMSLSDLFQAFTDTMGKEATHTLMLRAGRSRGMELAKMAGLNGPPTPENIALINQTLDAEKLGQINEIAPSDSGLVVKYNESFESAVEMGPEDPGSSYTAGILSGIGEYALKTMFSVQQTGTVAKDGADSFLLTPL